MSDQQYTQLCSEKTLQTNKEGFFLEFANAVAEKVGKKWIKNVFGKLKTDKDRIRIIYEDDKIKHYVIEFLSNVQEIYRKKCVETATRTRLEAEKASQNGDNIKSLAFFSQSVLRAPQKDENLPLALLGRSKVLISMDEYLNALTDIQLSLKTNLPNSLRSEAFLQMSICYKALGQEDKAKIAYNLAGKKTNLLIQKSKNDNKIEKTIPKIFGKTHPEFPYASNKIKVKKSTENGRYVAANEDIQTGEVLIVEPAYVYCLLPEKFGTHCHHCFDRLLSPIGCPDCSSVAFCKPECRNIATSTYHKYECKFLSLLIGSGMSVLSHAALRIITQNSVDRSLEIYKNRENDKFYNLCTNSSKRMPEDFLQRTLMAAFLLRCLQKSRYFNNTNGTVLPTEEEYQIGELLLTSLQILQFNAHEVYETLCSKENRLKSCKLSYIGVALYPTVALFNHECYPAVTRHFIGKHIVISAIRPLSPDDVIAENYGPVFTCRKLIERQRSLSARYWFDCKCRACLEDWPILKEIPSLTTTRIKCPKCTQILTKNSIETCPQCKTIVTENVNVVKKCEEFYEKGLKFVEQGDKDEAIKILCSSLDEFHRVSIPPHKETHLAQEALRKCLADGGNTVECSVENAKS